MSKEQSKSYTRASQTDGKDFSLSKSKGTDLAKTEAQVKWQLSTYVHSDQIASEKIEELERVGIQGAMNGLSISKARRFDEKLTKGIVSLALSRAFSFYGVDSLQMLSIMVDVIIQAWGKVWRLDDVILMLQMGMTGKFGKSYGKFNGAIMNEWCMMYDSMRTELCVERAQSYGQGVADASERSSKRHNGPNQVAQWTDEQLERIKHIDNDIKTTQ